MDGEVDHGPGTRNKGSTERRLCHSRTCCGAPTFAWLPVAAIPGDIRGPEREVLETLLWAQRRGTHLAAGDRPPASQPGGERHRCGTDSQPIGRPQPNSGRSRDGYRHGPARTHLVRFAERRSDQQQHGRLYCSGERRCASDRIAAMRVPSHATLLAS
jgi:hypothetical protein